MTSNPLTGLKLGKVFNEPYVMTSPFNAPRNYSAFGGNANGKHEGADFDVIGGSIDNKNPVLCAYDGIVERSLDSTGGYAKYVRVQHERNGSVFYTRYCHLDERYVSVGQEIKQGDAIGEIGSTGFVSAEHLHFNLEVPIYGLSGYIVANVVDPMPYF